MIKYIPIGILVCLTIAVLSFGGMDPRGLAVAQIGLFSILAILLWIEPLSDLRTRLPWKGPVIVLVYLSLQSLFLSIPKHTFQEHGLRIVAYCCAFLLVSYTVQRRNDFRKIALFVVGLGLVEAVYGLVQYLSNSHYIFAYEKQAYLSRASGTYVNPNHFAGFLGMVLPIAFSFVLFNVERGTLKKGSNDTSDRIMSVTLFSIISLLIFSGIIVSQSRMGIIAAVFTLSIMGILWESSSWHRYVVATMLIVFFGVSLLIGIWIGLEPVVDRYETLESSLEGRQNIWIDSLSMIKENPFLGTGMGTFRDVYTKHQTVFLTKTVVYAHNDYLQIASEWGIVGAALIFGLIFYVLFRGLVSVRRRTTGLDRALTLGCCASIISVLLHSFFDFNLQIPANALMFVISLGLIFSNAGLGRD